MSTSHAPWLPAVTQSSFELCGASKLRSEVAVQVSTPLCRTYDRLTRVVNETTKGGWDARPYSIAHYGEQVDFYTRVGTRWAGHKSPVGSSKHVALCPGEDSGSTCEHCSGFFAAWSLVDSLWGC